MTRKAWIALGGVSALAAALAIALAVSLSGDDEDAFGRPPAVGIGAGAPDPERMKEFQDCLDDEGVEAPERGTTPQSGPPEGFEEALETCGDLLPEGFGPGPGGPGGFQQTPFGPPG